MRSIKKGSIVGQFRILKILKSFRVLYDGWEMDNSGYLVEYEPITSDGKTSVGYVLSSHGHLEVTDSDDFIKEKIAEYENTLIATKSAYVTKSLYDSAK
jgi:hypothetical protein